MKYLEWAEKLPTFASAFENERCYKSVTKFEMSKKKEFFEKITINREVVVQEADFASTLYNKDREKRKFG